MQGRVSQRPKRDRMGYASNFEATYKYALTTGNPVYDKSGWWIPRSIKNKKTLTENLNGRRREPNFQYGF